VLRDLSDWWLDPAALPPERRRSLLRRFVASVRADQATLRRYESKYGHAEGSRGSVVGDAVKKIGFQIMVSVRWMHLLRDAGLGLPARMASRMIRHAYGSDVHWDAEFAPGVMIIHGMGLAVSHAARIGPGCMIFQNVTMGMGNDPVTRQTGAPTLEADVHVGPGCTLIGPITVGAGSKLMAGSVLDHSVPPRSVVEPARPAVRTRGTRPAPGAPLSDGATTPGPTRTTAQAGAGTEH
jgi:serine acetyltransferase